MLRSSMLLVAVAALGTSAHAFEFRVRWVERVGNTDTVLPGNVLDGSVPTARRLRLQMGVFDDAAGAAPAGGFIGWNVGSITISGPANNSIDRRTNGRIAPFTFAVQPNANGNPPPAGGLAAGDLPGTDFQQWTAIDATLAPQSPFWGFDANGDPLPQPAPQIRGLNTFISVYEITTQPVLFLSYTITATGNVFAATEWRPVGTPLPPDPDSGTPGSVTYAPLVLPAQTMTSVLNVIVPAPGSALLVIAGMLGASRRRR